MMTSMNNSTKFKNVKSLKGELLDAWFNMSEGC